MNRKIRSKRKTKSNVRSLDISYKIAYGAYRYAMLRFFKERRAFGCSIAPTIECNLNCEICYEKENRQNLRNGKKELSKDEMSLLADRLTRQGIKHCTMTDGEPLLTRGSKEKCELLIDKFWICYLVTNGTMEFPDFPVLYIVSLDGPPHIHDKLRGEGVYQKIRSNVKKAPTDSIYGLMTIHRKNFRHIAETLETASELGLRGMMFNWYTPSNPNDSIWLPYGERRRNIDEILRLREDAKLGSLICNTEHELSLLRTPRWTRGCPQWYIVSIDAFGNEKRRCIFGRKAICERCGCHVFPALLGTIEYGKQTVETRLISDFIKTVWFGLEA